MNSESNRNRKNPSKKRNNCWKLMVVEDGHIIEIRNILRRENWGIKTYEEERRKWFRNEYKWKIADKAIIIEKLGKKRNRCD